ncbi:toll/interleukin-1 receptor domain-containing adapter protein [Protopterus annectens]|uniref:toll/interleukin-1 receptor domain-containing adapter protein n=1 Tax=Protopterus annectens TaxID=7888 RepID=UPI001CFA0003|nr:toll/interleukin-1 receptor domain-containing adapter protein [Protopterus annectens]
MAGWIKSFFEKTKKGTCKTEHTKTGTSPQTTSSLSVAINGSIRWSKDYDVLICHSEEDISYVKELVSYLESTPERFRCFLQLRDSSPGSAICTELSEAVRNSHCWVMVITASFLNDPWCKYQMHQALSESPLPNGRTIPLVRNLSRNQYPEELRFIYYTDTTMDQDGGFAKVKKTITYYLENICKSNMMSCDSVEQGCGSDSS